MLFLPISPWCNDVPVLIPALLIHSKPIRYTTSSRKRQVTPRSALSKPALTPFTKQLCHREVYKQQKAPTDPANLDPRDYFHPEFTLYRHRRFAWVKPPPEAPPGALRGWFNVRGAVRTWGFCELQGKSLGSPSASAARSPEGEPNPSTARWRWSQRLEAPPLPGSSQGRGLLQGRNTAAVNKEPHPPPQTAAGREQPKNRHFRAENNVLPGL